MLSKSFNVLYIALSSLQGRPMRSAFDELAELSGAVQLTPGNHPTASFEVHVAEREQGEPKTSIRKHHGFAFDKRKRDVWSSDAHCLVDADSVHPPIAGSPAAAFVERIGVTAWLEQAMARGEGTSRLLLETMYPGYVFGSGDELDEAMRLGVHLAVDISHVFMQIAQGSMHDATWRRLAAYEHIGEVHVSANDGRHDSHMPMSTNTFGLDWARERRAHGTPVVLECYMHRLSLAERRAQVELIGWS